jgi:hypothetical protein
MVGVRGFEPPTPASRTQYSTRLSYTPRTRICYLRPQAGVIMQGAAEASVAAGNSEPN